MVQKFTWCCQLSSGTETSLASDSFLEYGAFLWRKVRFFYSIKIFFSKYQQNGQHKNEVLRHFPSEFLGQIQEILPEYTDNQIEIVRFSWIETMKISLLFQNGTRKAAVCIIRAAYSLWLCYCIWYWIAQWITIVTTILFLFR